MLRKHVKEHWSTAVSIPSLAVADAYVVPEPVKAQLRAQLPSLLSDSSSKVRAITAYIIAQIGKHDWPEAWPDMISQIIQLLQSQDKNSVHGALRVFAEAADDIFDNKTLEIVQYLMPELLRVFVSEQQYGVRARGRALKIFNKSISLLREATSKSNFVAHATDDSTGSGSGSSSTSAGASNAEAVSNKQIALKLIEDYTPHWINAFLAVLSSPQTETTDYGLKANVLECCTSLVARFPKQTTNLMLPVVTPMWNNIVEGVSFYERLVVNAGDAGDAAAYDSDDEIISFDSFVYTVLQFIDALIERHTMRDVIKSNLAIFVYYIARYAQITWDQVSGVFFY